MIRPMIAETKRYGEYSKPGESIYDRPFQWGSRRIGPDLAREGEKQSSLWHWRHLENPQQLAPGSVMPAYEHLLSTQIDFKKITDRVWAASLLGAPYGEELTNAPAMARQQAETIAAEIVAQGGPVQVPRAGKPPLLILDSQAVALIAYLQRLGVDLFRPAPSEIVPATMEAVTTP
jgi:cytochrome c oxidase cbb3-type subunit I/II